MQWRASTPFTARLRCRTLWTARRYQRNTSPLRPTPTSTATPIPNSNPPGLGIITADEVAPYQSCLADVPYPAALNTKIYQSAYRATQRYQKITLSGWPIPRATSIANQPLALNDFLVTADSSKYVSFQPIASTGSDLLKYNHGQLACRTRPSYMRHGGRARRATDEEWNAGFRLGALSTRRSSNGVSMPDPPKDSEDLVLQGRPFKKSGRCGHPPTSSHGRRRTGNG